MSTDTQKPVAWMTHHDEPMLFPTEREAQSYCDDHEHPIPLYVDPVAAQPDLTQQTLDDVKAGIPARDAEIEALRKQVETLQAQLVDRSPEMQGTLVDESPKLQSQKQPVSGADGLLESPMRGMSLGQRIAHVGGRENAQGYIEFGSPMAVHALIQHVLRDFHRQGRVCHAPAQQEADKVDAALAGMVHAMFRSGNSVPVTRITIDRKQYDAAIDAARKELA